MTSHQTLPRHRAPAATPRIRSWTPTYFALNCWRQVLPPLGLGDQHMHARTHARTHAHTTHNALWVCCGIQEGSSKPTLKEPKSPWSLLPSKRRFLWMNSCSRWPMMRIRNAEWLLKKMVCPSLLCRHVRNGACLCLPHCLPFLFLA